ncbi:MAG: Panacea domain-containing protein [Candidatus Berkelbacteria bacterium]|nr:Panacea domain-containing protein [Candidatus Berkelbacteria bacterium]
MVNQSKYKNVILYLIQEMDGKVLEGKKKICKLLYFVDFGAFEKYGQSITGDKYIRMPRGPVPSNFDNIIKTLEDTALGIRKELKSPIHENPTTIYELKKEANLDIFSKEEKEILDWVIEIYSKLSGKELEDISHSEAPWLAVKRNGEEIPYELSYYRGTSF